MYRGAEGGGAIYCYSGTNSELNLTNCAFDKCTTPGRGGGVYCLNWKQVSVVDCNFTKCNSTGSPNRNGGAVSLYNVTRHCYFLNCLFNNNSAYDDGGGIAITKVAAVDSPECVVDCNFTYCYTGKDSAACGGGIQHWEPVAKLHFRNCRFEHCVSDSYGGGGLGIYLTTINSGTLIFSCFFHNNTSPRGLDVLFEGSGKTGRDLFSYSFSTTEGKRVHFGSTDTTDWLPRVNNITLNVDHGVNTTEESGDFPECGNDTHPCKTIGYALTIWSLFHENPIILYSSEYVESCWYIGVGTLPISKSAESETIFITTNTSSSIPFCTVVDASLSLDTYTIIHHSENSSASSLFSITSSGSIILISCTINADGPTQTNPFSTSLFIISSGEVTLTNVSFVDILLSSFPLVSDTSTTPIEMTDVLFSSIVRNEGNGSVFEKIVESGEMFAMNNVSLDGCVCNEGNGGGLFVVLNEGGIFTMGGDENVLMQNCEAKNNSVPLKGYGGGLYLILPTGNTDTESFTLGTSLSFSGCKAVEGNNLFLEAINLCEVVNEDQFKLTLSNTDWSDMCGYGDGELDGIIISLLIFLIPLSSPVYISGGSTGLDHFKCGFEILPCSTIDHTVRERMDGGQVEILSVDAKDVPVQLNDELEIKITALSIEGVVEGTGVVVSDTKRNTLEAMIKATASLTITNIVFTLPPTLQSGHISFISSSTSLTLEKASFAISSAPSEELAFGIIFVSGGELSINRMTVNDCSFSSSPVVSVSSALKVVLNNSCFEKIERGDGNGSVISCGDRVMSLTVDKCDISECKAKMAKGGGGAISYYLEGSNTLTIEKTKIELCVANTESGRGGGLLLLIDSTSSNFQLTNISFDENIAYHGMNMFVYARSLRQSCLKTKFDFQMDVGEGNEKMLMGRDENEFNTDGTECDLMTLWEYRSNVIYVSSMTKAGGVDWKGCGSKNTPCLSVGYGMEKLEGDLQTLMIDGESEMNDDREMSDRRILSKTNEAAAVNVTREGTMWNSGDGTISQILFILPSSLSHPSLIVSSIGSLTLSTVSFNSQDSSSVISFSLACVESGSASFTNISLSSLSFATSPFVFETELYVTLSSLIMMDIIVDGCLLSTNDVAKITLTSSTFTNITRNDDGPSVLTISSGLEMKDCSFVNCQSQSEQGSVLTLSENTSPATITFTSFLGNVSPPTTPEANVADGADEICSWSGSLLHIELSNVIMELITITNSSKGGLSVIDSHVTIVDGKFEHNDPKIKGYQSMRRNIICKGDESTGLSLESLKGGDGLLPNTPMWIRNEGCVLKGLPLQRSSSFAIPTLTSASFSSLNNSHTNITLNGALLLPCEISFKITANGNTSLNGTSLPVVFVNESAVNATIPRDWIEGGDDTVVSVFAVNGEDKALTEEVILKEAKNKTVEEEREEEHLTRGSGQISLYSSFPFLIFVILSLFLFLIVLVLLLKLKKQKKSEPKELPQKQELEGFEMMEEVKRKEREEKSEKEGEMKWVEGAGDHRRGKKGYEDPPNLSESQQRLLPLKDEQNENHLQHGFGGGFGAEEGRKGEQSKTMVISTNNTIQTMEIPQVKKSNEKKEGGGKKGEDNTCPPTTSSLGNLFEGIACDSPYELTIVDERDSLFNTLRRKEEEWKGKSPSAADIKKIEEEAAKVLFWVTNGVMHMMEKEMGMKTLRKLTSNDVFFGPERVIVIGMYAMGGRSAYFEEGEEGVQKGEIEIVGGDKELHRWFAPELLRRAVRNATPATLSFTIGMMLYEMLMYRVPFYDLGGAEAGAKICEHIRPKLGSGFRPGLTKLLVACFDPAPEKRPSLEQLKREFLNVLPEGTIGVTKGETFDIETLTSVKEEGGEEDGENNRSEGKSLDQKF